MREAMSNITKQTFYDFINQFKHPIRGISRLLFQTNLSMGEFNTKLRQNSAIMRGKVAGYVSDRRKGLTKSKMNGCDLLSVFLESPEIFDDDAIA